MIEIFLIACMFVALVFTAIRIFYDSIQAEGSREPSTEECLKEEARFFTGRLTQIRPEEGDDWKYGLDLSDPDRCHYCGIQFEGDEKKCLNCGGPR